MVLDCIDIELPGFDDCPFQTKIHWWMAYSHQAPRTVFTLPKRKSTCVKS